MRIAPIVLSSLLVIGNSSYAETKMANLDGYGNIRWYDSQELAREKISKVAIITAEENGKIVASKIFDGRKGILELDFDKDRFMQASLEFDINTDNAYNDYQYFSSLLIKRYGTPQVISNMYKIDLTNYNENNFVQYINNNTLNYGMGWDFPNNCSIRFNIWQPSANVNLVKIRYMYMNFDMLLDLAKRANEDINRPNN